MLERLLPGWTGKLFVLVLLGFASTDFVITMTLSAADAATHAVENPLLHHALGHHRILVTLILLIILAGVFLRGFGEAIGVAAFVCIPYLLLNAVVLARSVVEMLNRPELFQEWRFHLEARGSWPAILAASVLVFPRLALGMSGFETGVSVMPLVRGDKGDTTPPAGRIRNTRYLLLTAALLMSVYLFVSSLVTTVLIPARLMQPEGKATGRALAYLAHELLGKGFGSLYDLSTILILWFAGASAMAGLLNLIPRYLPRFGMAPKWVEQPRPLIVLLVRDQLRSHLGISRRRRGARRRLCHRRSRSDALGGGRGGALVLARRPPNRRPASCAISLSRYFSSAPARCLPTPSAPMSSSGRME